MVYYNSVFQQQIYSTKIYLSLLLTTYAELLQSHFEIISFMKRYFKVTF